jgi:WD40 repeat protein
MRTWTIGMVVVLAISPASATEPKASLALDRGELHGWSYCPAKSLVAVSQGRQLLLGRLDVPKKKLELLSKEPLETWSMEFSPDCSLLVMSESSGDEQHRVNGAAVWRIDGGKLTRLGQVDTFRYPVSGIAMSDDGKWLALVANSGELNVYRVDARGTTARSYQAPALRGGDQYMRVRWSKGKLIGGAYKGGVRLFTLDPASGKLSAPEELMSPTRATRMEGSLNTESGEIVMPGGARVFDVAFSADGARAWAVVESGQVFAWDVAEKAGPRVTVVDGLDGANAFAVSPDGALLAASGNYEAKLWRLDGAKATRAEALGGLVHVGKYVAVDQLHFVAKNLLVAGTGDLSKASLQIYAP